MANYTGPIPRISISRIEFETGDVIDLDGSELILLTGPNNSGKSLFLRELMKYIRGDDETKGYLVRGISVERNHTPENFLDYIQKTYEKAFRNGNQITLFDLSFQMSYLEMVAFGRAPLGSFANALVQLESTDQRLTEHGGAPFNPITESPTTPLHALLADENIENTLSAEFSSAFGVDLIVHRGPGATIPIYVGKRPEWSKEKDRASNAHMEQLSNLPILAGQGDGMRSFARLLLALGTFNRSILLIDEPEAFLHPPQARILGRIIAKFQRRGIQIFVSTHSKDIVNGVVEARPERLKIGRITRDTKPAVKWLSPDHTRTFINDPLMRATNALDSLFHKKVVLCEGDRDAVFYNELLNAIKGEDFTDDVLFLNTGGKHRMPDFIDALQGFGVRPLSIVDIDLIRSPELVEKFIRTWELKVDVVALCKQVTAAIESQSIPVSAKSLKGEDFTDDVLFLNTGGKHRMPDFIDALQGFGVRPLSIVDIDLIRSPELVEKFIRTWELKVDVVALCKQVTAAIESQSIPVSAKSLKEKIDRVFEELDDLDKRIPKPSSNRIASFLSELSPFSIVKRGGWRQIPPGDAQKKYKEIDTEFRRNGVWLVPEGELEGLFRAGGAKGRGWFEEALKRDFRNDPDLEDARQFIRKVFE